MIRAELISGDGVRHDDHGTDVWSCALFHDGDGAPHDVVVHDDAPGQLPEMGVA